MLTPLLDADGAKIVVVITDEASRSKPFELNLLPLPPAKEGAVNEVINAMDEFLKAATEALGKQYPDEWEIWRDNSLNQMPEYLIPLMHTWHAILDEKNENALINQQFDADTLHELERILAALPVIEWLTGEQNFVASGGSLLNKAADLSMLRTSTINHPPPAPMSIMMAQPPTPTKPERWEIEGMLEINDAPTLAKWLNEYEKARKLKRDLELFDATMGTYLAAIATIGALPAGPGGALLVSSARLAALNAISNIVAFVSNSTKISMWFMPCCIVDLDVTLKNDGLIQNEDADENQMSLSKAVLAAESEAVNLTRELVDGIAKQVAVIVNDSINDAVTDLYSKAVSDQFEDYGAELFTSSYFSKLFPPGSDMYFSWKNIDLMADSNIQNWLTVRPDTFGSGGSPILEEAETSPNKYEFKLRAPEAFYRNDSQLRFLVNQDKLHSQSPIVGETKKVVLNYIEVEFEPRTIRLERGDTEPVPFTVTVNNSAYPTIDEELEITPEYGKVVRLSSQPENGVFEYEYHPPENFPEEVVTIRAYATSDKNLRKSSNDPPERRGAMFISLTNLDMEIIPATSCIEHGKTLSFTAQNIHDKEHVDVTWEVNFGEITPDGIYTAPSSGSGEIIITAATKSVSAQTRFAYGDCSCWWKGSVRGEFNQSHAWNLTSVGLDDQSRIVSIKQLGRSNISGFEIDLSDNPIPAGATGTYEARLAPSNSLSNSFSPANVAWTNPTKKRQGQFPGVSLDPLQVTITTHEILSGPSFEPGSRQPAIRRAH